MGNSLEGRVAQRTLDVNLTAGRVGRPEDVAELALYLASDQAEFMTGQVLILDGGMTRKMVYAE
ncbi:MAG: SDR family oxidoreductase [Myxococcales bacterium]